MTTRTRMVPLALVLAIVASCDGETAPPEASLVVTVRTDYAPGEEFTGVVARLGTTRRELVARRADDYGAGVDLPAFDALTGGATVDLDVELVDGDGTVARRAVVVSLEASGVTRTTVLLERADGDAGVPDAGAPDAGPGGSDAGPGTSDAGPGTFDAGPGTFDAGPGTFDAGPRITAAVGYGASRSSLAPADFGCRGSVSAPPESGSSVGFTAEVRDFQSNDPISGLTTDVFAGDVPAGSCGAGCTRAISSASGTVSASDVAGSWFAYRVHAGNGSVAGLPRDYVEQLGYHLTAPSAGGSVVLYATAESTLSTIVTLLGVSTDPGTATVIGTLYDCGGEPIANATIRVFDATGEIALGSGRMGPRAFYFSGGLPGSREVSTNVDGLFGATNVPVPLGGRLRVELWGARTAGAAPELLGCEAVEGLADGMTTVEMGPRRADGPSDCSP